VKRIYFSVIIPVYNEEKNIFPLFGELKDSLISLFSKKKIRTFEIIFVNDGSTDGTQKNLELLKAKNKQILTVIEFRKHFGQTPALKAGFSIARGDLIVTMDGDLQNDPEDIKRLIEKIDQGYDAVSGWRYERKDSFAKKVLSQIMNFFRKKVIGDNLHDYGCALKIYKKECVKDLRLVGELHRYITAYLYIKGYKIGEIKVNHRERKTGRTKYRFNRGINGILDLFYLKFWSDFSDRPLHFFGRIGIYQWVLAVFIVIEQSIKAILVKELRFGPLLALSLLLAITGLLVIIFGFLFETLSRIYSKQEEVYSIKKIL
jgi:glycosyltransferase involved in cell wall biosynthesis